MKVILVVNSVHRIVEVFSVYDGINSVEKTGYIAEIDDSEYCYSVSGFSIENALYELKTKLES